MSNNTSETELRKMVRDQAEALSKSKATERLVTKVVLEECPDLDENDRACLVGRMMSRLGY